MANYGETLKGFTPLAGSSQDLDTWLITTVTVVSPLPNRVVGRVPKWLICLWLIHKG